MIAPTGWELEVPPYDAEVDVDANPTWMGGQIQPPTIPVMATVELQDCIIGMAEMAPESVDLCVTSIPFGSLFMYSAKPEDIGNNTDGIDMRDGDFALHLRFFLAQLERVMKPGTITAIHIQQLLTYQVQHGYQGRRDFRGSVVDMVSSAGFHWVGEVAIPKNPQAMAQRLKLHSLLFITAKRNGRKLAPAVNDYLMVFQKQGESEPVPCLYDPESNPGGWITKNEWIKWASGVWGDIQETDVLDGYRSARGEDDERHVCPIQLEPVRRLVKLYSNPGDLVLDPFSGIGSVQYVCVEQARNAIGFELKESYHAQCLANIAKAQELKRSESMPVVDLFSSAGIAL
jgi:DNA modification methylase